MAAWGTTPPVRKRPAHAEQVLAVAARKHEERCKLRQLRPGKRGRDGAPVGGLYDVFPKQAMAFEAADKFNRSPLAQGACGKCRVVSFETNAQGEQAASWTRAALL